MLQGKNVANVKNCDERLVQKIYIHGSNQGHEVIVLGSSRSLHIDSTFFPGKTFYNHAISGASLEDLIGVYQSVVEQEQKPTTVILGLDPWFLNRQNGLVSWIPFANEFQTGLRRMGLPLDPGSAVLLTAKADLVPLWTKAMNLLSPAYFQTSFKMILRSQGGMPYATDLTIGNEWIKLADGSENYDLTFQNRSQDLVNQDARRYVNLGTVYGLDRFSQLDPQYEQWLEAFVNRMQADDATVIFYLSPYHPYVYNYLMASDQYNIVKSTQTYYTDLASKKHILVLGSYDPNDLGCAETEFFDGMHPKLSCITKIFQQHP